MFNYRSYPPLNSRSITLRGAFFLAVAVGMFALIASSHADQVTTAPLFGPYQTFNGGEFTITPDAPIAALLGAYSPYTINQPGYGSANIGSFQTFCAETSENINSSTTYDVTLNNVTIFGGDPLSAGAAFLYYKFATGQLDYDYTDTPDYGYRRYLGTQNAANLQNAIWYLMNPLMAPGQGSNPYVLEADTALGGAAAALAPAGASNYGVQILNLWTVGQPHTPTYSIQDLLIYTAVPEPSVLALVSLTSLLALRRRK